MLFLAFSNADVSFIQKKLIWKSYITSETLPITKRVKVIDQKEFAIAALDLDEEAFVIYVAFLSLGSKVAINPAREVQIAALDNKKVIILPKYLNYSNVFSKASAAKLFEYININDHLIDLVDDKQPPYSPIYNLGLVELEMLKTYIKTNLAHSFIWPSQSLAGTSILFIKKKDASLQLCVYYRGFNNWTIKNWYLLSLIDKFLDCLGRAKHFI